MIDSERIEKLSNTIFQESEGKYNASFRIKSETDNNVWYDLNWNIYEIDPARAFRCECMSWQLNSNNGICKHTIALCKRLVYEGSLEKHQFEKMMKEYKNISP